MHVNVWIDLEGRHDGDYPETIPARVYADAIPESRQHDEGPHVRIEAFQEREHEQSLPESLFLLYEDVILREVLEQAERQYSEMCREHDPAWV